MRIVLILILSFFVIPLHAQKNPLACPVKINRKTKSFGETNTAHITIGAGWQFSVPYRNPGVKDKDYYQFTSDPRPFTNIFLYQPLSGNLDLTMGFQLGLCVYGLQTTEQVEGGQSAERFLTEVFQLRLPLGIGYQCTRGLHIAFTPALVYATQFDYSWSHHTYGNNGGTLLQRSEWGSDSRKKIMLLSFDVKVMQRLYKHLHLGAHVTADSRSLFYMSGTNLVAGTGNTPVLYSRRIDPLMFYGGLALAYRFF